MLRRGLILDLGLGLGKFFSLLFLPWGSAQLPVAAAPARDWMTQANGYDAGLGFVFGNAFWYELR